MEGEINTVQGKHAVLRHPPHPAFGHLLPPGEKGLIEFFLANLAT